MGIIDQAAASLPANRCPRCNIRWESYDTHADSEECRRAVTEREIYRAGWIKLADLPEWETPYNSDEAYAREDWWPRRVIQKFNAIHGKGAIMLRANPLVGYTQHWVRVWAIQVLMERMAAVSRDPDAERMTVDEGVALLKAYHDGFAGGAAIPEDLKRPDEIAAHLAGSVPIPDWWRFGWFRAWVPLG